MDMNAVPRRQFLQASSALGVGLTAAILHPRQSYAAPKKRVRLGFIGVGGRGIGHVERTIRREDVEVPAICDIDTKRLEYALGLVAKTKGKKPEGYCAGEEDYQRMVARDDRSRTNSKAAT